MGELKPAEWYDGAYEASRRYRGAARRQPWYFLWSAVANQIPEDKRVMDLGCGMGQLYEVLVDKGRAPSFYCGVDFSTYAVSVARRRWLGPMSTFFVRDLTTYDSFPDIFDYYVLCEVLEHVEDDVGIIERIPAGKHVIITVPKNDSASHVRSFESVMSIHLRYGRLLANTLVREIGKNHFIATAKKK